MMETILFTSLYECLKRFLGDQDMVFKAGRRMNRGIAAIPQDTQQAFKGLQFINKDDRVYSTMAAVSWLQYHGDSTMAR